MRLTRIACVVTLTLVPTLASATVLTFDDLPGTGGTIPFGYQDLNWDQFVYLNPMAGNYPPGYHNGLVSGSNVAVAIGNYVQAPRVWSDIGAFDFISGYFTGGLYESTVDVYGAVNGHWLKHTTFTVGTAAPTFMAFNWLGVDAIQFATHDTWSGQVTNLVVDDLALNNIPTPVPEPGTLVLLGSGLIWSVRRRLRAPQHDRIGAAANSHSRG